METNLSYFQLLDIYDNFYLKITLWSPWFIQKYFSIVRVNNNAGADTGPTLTQNKVYVCLLVLPTI